MRFPKAGDKRAPGGGNRLAFADRLHQAIEIGEDAIGGLVEPCCIRRGERTDGLLEFLTGPGQRLERVLAFGRIDGGEQAGRRGGDLIGGPDDLGSTRDLGQAFFGDNPKRTPKAVVGDNGAAARQHGERGHDAESRKQSTAKAQVIPR